MNKVIVICGPTGVGKTRASINVAKRYNGEVINADAVQVYRGLDIGSAKIKKEEMDGIVHHLFDIRDVSEEYSIYDYQRECRNIIDDIISRGKTPIMVGGSGLYIKSCLYNYKLDDKKYIDDYGDIDTDSLYQELIELDPLCIGEKYVNNRKRIINALNYYKENGKSITLNKTDELLYDSIFIGLTTDRDNLYKIINNRVDKMISEGLEEEVRYYYNRGIFSKVLTGGIGYREFYDYFEGKISICDCIEKIKQDSRHYAKRQYTFFNHQLPVKWFFTDYVDFDNTLNEIYKYIEDVIR